MPDAPTRHDVLVLIPKRDELRAAAMVFGFDSTTPDGVIEEEHEHWTVAIGELNVTVVLADSQGNAKVALATSRALTALDPVVVMCIGTAAGREERVSYLDVVLATGVIDLTEWRKVPDGLQPQWEMAPKPSSGVLSDIDDFVKRDDWREEAADGLASTLGALGVAHTTDGVDGWPRVHDGWMVTTTMLQEDGEFLDTVWALNARLRSVDMETAGFVDACTSKAKTRPWIVVRSVSDFGTRASKRDSTRPAAGAAAAVVARSLITCGLQRAHPLSVEAPPASQGVLSDENFFARMTMPEFLADQLPRHFGIAFGERSFTRDLTVADLAALCGDTPEVRADLDGLRELYFTSKYLSYDDEADVRGYTGQAWAEEVKEILEHLRIAPSQSDILYVGIGTGRDLADVCPTFKTLVGVDLSAEMLEQARERQPDLQVVRAAAENLAPVEEQSADLYLALRTYQSSLFDMPAAVRQAHRVLRSGGAFLISIPGGFLDRSGKDLRYIPGLLVPGSKNLVDRALPRRYATEILGLLDRLTFDQVGFQQRDGDVYVYGKKS